MPAILTTATPMSNGVASVTGVPRTYRLTITGTWVTGDTWNLTLTNTVSGLTIVIGYGTNSGKTPVFALTLRKKVYALYEAIAAFSEVDSAVSFNSLIGIGNGTLNTANNLGTPEDLVAAGVYQKRLALFSPNVIQTWIVNADANLYELDQTFEGVGTNAPQTVKSLGILDVIFLSSTGVRSLRAREYTLDADTIDIGSPVDALIQDAYEAGANETVACAAVEPRYKRYVLFFNGVVYVLSSFRGSKITAWTTYTPSYETEHATGNFDGFGGSIFNTLIVGQTYHYTTNGSASWRHDGVDYTAASGTFVATLTTVTGNGGTPTGSVAAELSLIGQRQIGITKMVVDGSKLYFRGDDHKVYILGGTAGTTYDKVVAKLETPWLDDGSPTTEKITESIDAGFAGEWTVKVGMDPLSGTLQTVFTKGSQGTPNANVDSTFDSRRMAITLKGTHMKMQALSSGSSNKKETFSEFHVLYQAGGTS